MKFKVPGNMSAGQILSRRRLRAVVSGSYRKFPEALRRDLLDLHAIGVTVLSPPSSTVLRVVDGFASLVGDAVENIDRLPAGALRAAFRFIEDGHLRAIREADFLWVTAENGYFGRSTAFEIGYAHRHGVPVYARLTQVEGSHEPIVLSYVQGVTSLGEVVARSGTPEVLGGTRRENPAVAVGAVVLHGDHVLLVRNDDWGGRYTIVGGRLFEREDLVEKTLSLVGQQAGVEGKLGRPVYAGSMLPGSGYVDPTAHRQYIDHVFLARTPTAKSGCTWRRLTDALNARDIEPNALEALRALAR